MDSNAKNSGKCQIWTDGGSRGNPGQSAFAAVVQTENGSTIAELSGYIGKSTNNVAEYEGFLAGLRYAVERAFEHVHFYSDSELLVNQVLGRYRIKNSALFALHSIAQSLIPRLKTFSISHIPRSKNAAADAIVNRVLDQFANVIAVPSEERSNAGVVPRLVLEANCSVCGQFVEASQNPLLIPEAALQHTKMTGHIVVLNGTSDLPNAELSKTVGC